MSGDKSKPAVAIIEVRRQLDRRSPHSWDRFLLTLRERMTVADALDAIATEPYTATEQWVAPVVWAGRCSPAGCGPCTMLINSIVRPACTTMLSDLTTKGRPIRLEPLSKLPLVRDLLVDRSRLSRALVAFSAWVDTPATNDEQESTSEEQVSEDGMAKEAREASRRRLSFARCSQCLACLEACPQTRAEGGGGFVGAATIAQSHLAELHPDAAGSGQATRHEALMQPGGIAECSHALNCVEVCPEQLPLDDALAACARKATRRFWRNLFG